MGLNSLILYCAGSTPSSCTKAGQGRRYHLASPPHLDLSRAPGVLYGVEYIDLVSPSGQDIPFGQSLRYSIILLLPLLPLLPYHQLASHSHILLLPYHQLASHSHILLWSGEVYN